MEKQIHFVITIALTLLIMASCHSTRMISSTKQEQQPNSSKVETKNLQNLSLVDYLRRIPGISVSGHGETVNILVRGISTVYGQSNPLFVIDNTPVGTDYNQAARLVDTNDISSVALAKDPVTISAFGIRGSNGVIMITTKHRKKKVNS